MTGSRLRGLPALGRFMVAQVMSQLLWVLLVAPGWLTRRAGSIAADWRLAPHALTSPAPPHRDVCRGMLEVTGGILSKPPVSVPSILRLTMCATWARSASGDG